MSRPDSNLSTDAHQSDADSKRGAREPPPNSTIRVMNDAITNLANAAMKITISADNNFDPTKLGLGAAAESHAKPSPSPQQSPQLNNGPRVKSPPSVPGSEGGDDQPAALPPSMPKKQSMNNERRRNSLFLQFKNKIKDGFKSRGDSNRNSSSSTSSEKLSSDDDSGQNSESNGDPDEAKKSKKGKKRHKNKHAKASTVKDPFHDKHESLVILKQAYYSLLCAILDPTSHMREKHSFQFKTFNKLTTCDECKSILWGLNKQGLQCQKCFMNIHEKCQELIQEDCAQQRIKNTKSIHGPHSSSSAAKGLNAATGSPHSPTQLSSSINPIASTTSSSANLTGPAQISASSTQVSSGTSHSNAKGTSFQARLENNTAFLQLALVTRFEDVKRAYPNYFAMLNEIFKPVTDDVQNDVRQVQKDYLNKNIRQMKSRLKIFVKNAVNLVAKDSNGTSDPYVTIQCGYSKIKRTKTQKKNLNPIWNEYIEFEYYNTADGISGELRSGGDKLIIRVWDEDVGIKAQLDKMLTKESDDFLGQLVFDIHSLNLNGEQAYQLKPRTDGSVITGYITLGFTLTSFEVGGGAGTTNNNVIVNNVYTSRESYSKGSGDKGTKYTYLEQYRCLHKHLFDYVLANWSRPPKGKPGRNLDRKQQSSLNEKNLTRKRINLDTMKQHSMNLSQESPETFMVSLTEKSHDGDLIENDEANSEDPEDEQTVFSSNNNTTPKWLLECIPSVNYKEAPKSNFFREPLYNLILKQFSNKYVIGDLQKQMLHFECFVSYFVDGFLLDKMTFFLFKKRDPYVDCRILEYMGHQLNTIGAAYSTSRIEIDSEVRNISALINNDFLLAPKNLQSNISITNNRRFLHETCTLPNKIMLLLGNYRSNYAVKYRIKTQGTLEIDVDDHPSAMGFQQQVMHLIDEMNETVRLFKTCCDFIQKHVLPKSFKNIPYQEYRYLFDLAELKTKYPNIDMNHLNGFNHEHQIAALRKCIESAIHVYFANTIFTGGNLSSSSSSLNGLSANTIRSSTSSVNNKLRLNEDGSLAEVESNSLAHRNILTHQNTSSLTSEHSILVFNIQSSVENLMNILSEKLFLEIEINDKLYTSAFCSKLTYSSVELNLREMCTRLLIKNFLYYLFETIKNDKDVIHKLRPDHVKLHLNLYILLHKFLVDNKLDKISLSQLLSYTFFPHHAITNTSSNAEFNRSAFKHTSLDVFFPHHSHRSQQSLLANMEQNIQNIKYQNLNEFFQPFLIEFIYQQEDQFIKYVYKIYDIDKINKIAHDVSSAIHYYKTNKSFSIARQSFLASLNSANGGAASNMMLINSHNKLNLFSRNDSPNVKLNKILCEMENYYSTSVTDLFTILHELLQTILQFDSDDSNLNLMHHMCFVNLIKSKLLTYSSHVKKEYQKLYKQVVHDSQVLREDEELTSSDNEESSPTGQGSSLYGFKVMGKNKPAKSLFSSLTSSRYTGNGHRPSIFSTGRLSHETRPTNQFTITTCILMNNFKKIVELLDEIEAKLKARSKIKRIVIDQLESIKLVLHEDLSCMIEEYSREYQPTLTNACQLIQVQLNGQIKQINTEYIHLMDNLIDEILYNSLNDKFMLCKTILFDDIFKRLLEEIFKISVKCVEDSIILRHDGHKLNFESLNNDLEFLSASPTPPGDDKRSGGQASDPNSSTLFNRFGKMFESVFSSASAQNGASSLMNSSSKENTTLLNRLQYKIIQHALVHIIEFFSADEECLTKDYLLKTQECQCAFKTLDLYLNSFNQLISNFVKSQNMQQNNIDFSKTFGKINIEIEMKQNNKYKNEFNFVVRLIEARDLVPAHTYTNGSTQPGTMNHSNPAAGGFANGARGGGDGSAHAHPANEFSLKSFNLLANSSSSTYSPFVEIFALGPFEIMNKWPKKIVRCYRVPDSGEDEDGDHSSLTPATSYYNADSHAIRYYFKPDSNQFEFKLSLNNEQMSNLNTRDFLDDFEIQIIVYDTNCPKQFKITGISVFNLNQAVGSAQVWRRLMREENPKDANQSNLLYSAMNLWLPLRPRLKINDDGYKMLKVLDRFNENKRVLEFIQLKYSARYEQTVFHSSHTKTNKNILDLYLINEEQEHGGGGGSGGGGGGHHQTFQIPESDEIDDYEEEQIGHAPQPMTNDIKIKITNNDY